MGLPELKRLRRQFVKQVSGLGALSGGQQDTAARERAMAEAFVEYINTSIA